MRDIRKQILGDHKPAHTLVIAAGLAFEEYQIEVGDNLCFAVTVDDGEASNSKTYCVEIEESED